MGATTTEGGSSEANDARTARTWRGVLDIVASVPQFYLWRRQNLGSYTSLVYTGSAQLAIGAIRLLFKSPAEKAWTSYQDANGEGRSLQAAVESWDLDLFSVPLPGGAMAGVKVAF